MKFEEPRWNRLPDADDVLLDIAGCTIAILVRGRNAWHSTWVRHWFRNSHLFSDPVSAKDGGEERRGPGNVFYVRQRPALVLRGRESRVIAFDGFSDDPFQHFGGVIETEVDTGFGRYLKGVFPGVTLREAAERFGGTSEFWRHGEGENQVRFGLVLPGQTLAGVSDGPFDTWTSRSRGSDYDLGWEPDFDSDITTVHLRRRAREWHALLAAVPGAQDCRAAGDWDVLAELLRARLPKDGLPARSRAGLRERYEAAIASAEGAVAEAREVHDDAEQAEDSAAEAAAEAEEFANDPWARVFSAMRHPEATSGSIRRVRERAVNARAQVEQAEEELEAATANREEAWERLREARRHLNELMTL